MGRLLKVLLIFGTRPEAIKLAPVVKVCRMRADQIETIVCSTGQHQELLRPVLDYFEIKPARELHVMEASQGLSGLTSRCLEAAAMLLEEQRPDCVVAQGDTTTTMAAALASFYARVPFVHVEAGLRTGNLQAPWPEELNRRIAGAVASLHCAPTQRAKDNLLAEGVPADQVYVTGNTVVDALLETLEREQRNGAVWGEKYAFLGERPLVLVTGHRRENFGRGLQMVCRAIAQLAERFPCVTFLYPAHLNPHVREPVTAMLQGLANVHVTPPAPYPEFVWLMNRSRLILSDSGGIQEEAPSLKKPVVVTRETTERREAVEAGVALLAGASTRKIVRLVARLLTDQQAYRAMQPASNPFGDGRSAARIVDLILQKMIVQEVGVERDGPRPGAN